MKTDRATIEMAAFDIAHVSTESAREGASKLLLALLAEKEAAESRLKVCAGILTTTIDELKLAEAARDASQAQTVDVDRLIGAKYFHLKETGRNQSTVAVLSQLMDEIRAAHKETGNVG